MYVRMMNIYFSMRNEIGLCNQFIFRESRGFARLANRVRLNRLDEAIFQQQ